MFIKELMSSDATRSPASEKDHEKNIGTNKASEDIEDSKRGESRVTENFHDVFNFD